MTHVYESAKKRRSHTRPRERTLGDELHLGRAERVILRDHDVHLEHAARIGRVIRTLQRLKSRTYVEAKGALDGQQTLFKGLRILARYLNAREQLRS